VGIERNKVTGKMIFCIQVLIYLFFFTVSILAVVAKGPEGGLFFYPKNVQQRVLELGLIDDKTVRKRKKWFSTALVIVIAILPILFIGIWNRVTDFPTAYVQTLILLEIMNWYDGIVIDRLWVGHSKFWVIKGCEDLSYTKSIKFVLIERGIMTLVYLPVAAIIAKIAVLVAGAV
jgi:hypothetical protein